MWLRIVMRSAPSSTLSFKSTVDTSPDKSSRSCLKGSELARAIRQSAEHLGRFGFRDVLKEPQHDGGPLFRGQLGSLSCGQAR